MHYTFINIIHLTLILYVIGIHHALRVHEENNITMLQLSQWWNTTVVTVVAIYHYQGHHFMHA